MRVSILRDILGSSALHLAFMTGNVGLASVLLKYGADLYVFFLSFVLFHLSLQHQNRYAKNKQRSSVLDVAQSNGHEKSAALFCHFSYCERNKMKMPHSKLDELNKKKRNGGSPSRYFKIKASKSRYEEKSDRYDQKVDRDSEEKSERGVRKAT